jgi:hypothetical protein
MDIRAVVRSAIDRIHEYEWLSSVYYSYDFGVLVLL